MAVDRELRLGAHLQLGFLDHRRRLHLLHQLCQLLKVLAIPRITAMANVGLITGRVCPWALPRVIDGRWAE